jgi:hypothetical protein
VNQEIESMLKKKESIDAMYTLTGEDGQPFFSLAYLIENLLGMTEDDIAGNKEAKKKRAEEKEKAGKEETPAAEGETPAEGEPPAETPPAEEETPETT